MAATEAPSQRRLREARASGNVPRSRQLAAASVLLVGWGALVLQIPVIVAELGGLARVSFAAASAPSTPEVAGEVLWHGLGSVGWSLLPPLAVLWIATAVVGFLQVGPVLTGQALRPDASRLSPSANLQRVLKQTDPTDLVLQAVRIAALMGLVLHYTITVVPRIFVVAPGSLTGALLSGGDIVFGLAWRLALAMFLLGVLDYAWQRTRWLRSLNMTRREKELERREDEVDPRLRREMARQQAPGARQGGLDAVGQATLVATDGVSRAVALRYHAGTDSTPVVIARGEGRLGLAILASARRQELSELVDPELTRSLWAMELDEAIAPRLFTSVAKVFVDLGLDDPS